MQTYPLLQRVERLFPCPTCAKVCAKRKEEPRLVRVLVNCPFVDHNTLYCVSSFTNTIHTHQNKKSSAKKSQP